jgi:hypothetical protein
VGHYLFNQPMFLEAKTKAYPTEAPFRCSTLGCALSLERPARDKHSSLVGSYGLKSCLSRVGSGLTCIHPTWLERPTKHKHISLLGTLITDRLWPYLQTSVWHGQTLYLIIYELITAVKSFTTLGTLTI